MNWGSFWIGLGLLALAYVVSPVVPKVSRGLDDLHELRVRVPEIQKSVQDVNKAIADFRKKIPFLEPRGDARSATNDDAAAAPTPQAEVDRVLNLLPRPHRGFVDYGCGAEARWCVAAAQKWGCNVIGIEKDRGRAIAARERVRSLGLSHLITIVEADAETVGTVEADVAAVYLYPDLLGRLKPRLEKFRAVASYMHAVPGLPMQRNGDSWIYQRTVQQTQQTGQRYAVWNGARYDRPVCNNPRCPMCNDIRQQLGF